MIVETKQKMECMKYGKSNDFDKCVLCQEEELLALRERIEKLELLKKNTMFAVTFTWKQYDSRGGSPYWAEKMLLWDSPNAETLQEKIDEFINDNNENSYGYRKYTQVTELKRI